MLLPPSALLLIALAFIPATASAVAGQESRGVVIYDGPITPERNRQLFEDLANPEVERLVIRSSGGDVEAGIALGHRVFEAELDVEVRDYCLSSCANYVFPAGRRKIIPTGAVVAWHGSYRHLQITDQWRDDIAYRMRELGEDAPTAERRAHRDMLRLVSLEQALFERIGVDGYLCWAGKLPPFDAPDYYVLSAVDMARFGVVNVEASPDYPPAELPELGVHLIHVRLALD
jgi:hypothetical protein